MKKEIIKAVVGFILLAGILGGMYYMIHMLAGDKTVEKKKQQDAYQIYHHGLEKVARQRSKAMENSLVETHGPEADPEEKQPVPDGLKPVSVRVKVFDHALKPVPAAALTLHDGSDREVALTDADGWLASPEFSPAGPVAIRMDGRSFGVGPFPLLTGDGLSAERVRVNWILGGSAEDGKAEKHKLECLDVACVETGSQIRLFFRGRAGLPDDSVLLLSLIRRGIRCTGIAVTVEGGLFSGMLEPIVQGFPSDQYDLMLEFNPADQSGEVLEHYGEDIPTLSAETRIIIGDLALQPQERQEDLSRLNSVFVKARRFLHQFFLLVRLGMTGKGRPWRLDQTAAVYFPKGMPKLSIDGRLNVKVWRYWMDTHFLEGLLLLQTEMAEMGQPIHVEVSVLVNAYLKEVVKLVKVGSMRVYQTAGLTPDPRDACPVSLVLDEEFAAVKEKLVGKRIFGRVIMQGLEGRLKKSLKDLADAQKEPADVQEEPLIR